VTVVTNNVLPAMVGEKPGMQVQYDGSNRTKSFAKVNVSAILLWGSSGFRTSSLVQYYLKNRKS